MMVVFHFHFLVDVNRSIVFPRYNHRIQTLVPSFRQDLNEKFQELETKMIEVEKCFKEANQRDLNEPPRASESNDFKASPETVPIVQQSRLYGMSECRKETNEFPSDGIKAWFVPHRSTVTEKNQFQSRIVRDGSGDGPQPNEMFSDDSFETLIKSTEKPVQLPNRQAAKGIFTIHRFDSRQEHGTSKNYTCKDSSTSGDDVDFLEKSKKLILTLIDKELNRIETNQKHYSPPTNATNPLVTKLDNLQDAKRSSLKMECISNIEKELETLKKLELSDQ